MRRVCEDCGMLYDDTYRLTFCPHERFEMRTWVVRGAGQEKLCTSLEEVAAFMAGSG